MYCFRGHSYAPVLSLFVYRFWITISYRTEVATSAMSQNIQTYDTGGQSRQEAITFPSPPTLSLLIMFALAGLREMRWKIQWVW